MIFLQVHLYEKDKYSGDLKSDHLKSDHLKFGNSWNSDFYFKRSGFQMVGTIAIVPTTQKPDHLKSRCFCLDFKCFLKSTAIYPDGWALGFQIQFKIWTICNPISFEPFKIQTSLDFRSPTVNRFLNWSKAKCTLYWVSNLSDVPWSMEPNSFSSSYLKGLAEFGTTKLNIWSP